MEPNPLIKTECSLELRERRAHLLDMLECAQYDCEYEFAHEIREELRELSERVEGQGLNEPAHKRGGPTSKRRRER